jgi:hypothetical protein
MQKLPNISLEKIDDISADKLHDLSKKELGDIPLDKVSLFPLMKEIGKAMVQKIEQIQSTPFCADLLDTHNRELLVSRVGDINTIKTNLSNSKWIDKFED